MNGPEQLIASVLDEIASQAGPARPMAYDAWRAGRRRRLTALTASALTGAAAITAALLLLVPLGGGGGAFQPPTAALGLRTPVQFRQVARISDAPCPAGSRGLPGSTGPGIPTASCIYVTGAGMTVTTVRSVRITPHADAVYLLNLRLTPAQARRFAALTKMLYREQPPRDQLAIIVHGRVIGDPEVIRPITGGIAQIEAATRAKADHLLRQLLSTP